MPWLPPVLFDMAVIDRPWFVCAVLFVCLAMLYPRLLHPAVVSWFSRDSLKDQENVANTRKPVSQDSQHGGEADKRTRSAHEFATRAKLRGGFSPAAEMRAQASQNNNNNSWRGTSLLPLYSIGVVLFLFYMLAKIFTKNRQHTAQAHVQREHLLEYYRNLRYDSDGKFSFGDDIDDEEGLQEYMTRKEQEFLHETQLTQDADDDDYDYDDRRHDVDHYRDDQGNGDDDGGDECAVNGAEDVEGRLADMRASMDEMRAQLNKMAATTARMEQASSASQPGRQAKGGTEASTEEMLLSLQAMMSQLTDLRQEMAENERTRSYSEPDGRGGDSESGDESSGDGQGERGPDDARNDTLDEESGNVSSGDVCDDVGNSDDRNDDLSGNPAAAANCEQESELEEDSVEICKQNQEKENSDGNSDDSLENNSKDGS